MCLTLEFSLQGVLCVADLVRLKVEEEARHLIAMQALDQHSEVRLGCEYQDLTCGTAAILPQPLDLEAEVRKAQQAFAEGRFLILVDGCRYTRLDEPVTLTPQSVARFIRLMPLTGG